MNKRAKFHKDSLNAKKVARIPKDCASQNNGERSFRRSPLVQLRASFVGSDPRMGICGISRCELCRSVRLLSWWPIWSQLSWTLSLEPFSLASFVFGKPFLVAIFLAVLPWIFYACAVKSDSAADTRKKGTICNHYVIIICSKRLKNNTKKASNTHKRSSNRKKNAWAFMKQNWAANRDFFFLSIDCEDNRRGSNPVF